MVIFEHQSRAYLWVREHRSAEKRHLQTGIAYFETDSQQNHLKGGLSGAPKRNLRIRSCAGGNCQPGHLKRA